MAIILTDNEFFEGLSNLALYMRLIATNTSRRPNAFVDSFATDTLAFGDTKIYPFTDLPTVKDYSETSSLLTVTKVPQNEEYIRITEEKFIPSSYSARILTMAVTGEEGLNEFIGYLLGQMESAKVDYMYDVIITDLFAKTPTGASQTANVTTLPASEGESASEINARGLVNNKRIALAVQNAVDNLEVFNTGYNAKGYKQAIDLADIKFIFCNPYKNENLIDLYATLLKSDVIERSFAKPEMFGIPTSKIPSGQDKVIGWLLDKRAYQWFYKFTFTGSFFDVSNLVVNNFLHFWFGKGWLDNLAMIKFVNTPAAG